MDDLPPIIPPDDFTGAGLEIVGNPNPASNDGTLTFMDGRLISVGMPVRTILPQATPENWAIRSKEFRRHRAISLAYSLKKSLAEPGDSIKLAEILRHCQTASPRERTTENAVRMIRNGDFSPCWSYDNRLERALYLAISDAARELSKPPTETEVVDRMSSAVDSIDGGSLSSADPAQRKHLVKALRDGGFGWLKRIRRPSRPLR